MSKKQSQLNLKIDKTDEENSKKNKWDKYIDDYKNYTKAYIKHYKKSFDGNPKSLIKYPYLKARSELVYGKLFEAQTKNLLTEKQLQKIAKIQIKIVKRLI